ncbi:hypothetical protein GCM10028807_58340 [Spirosoma daeguense]
MHKPKLLIFAEYFLPGYKWGGPIQSVANLIQILRAHYTIFLITRDRDFLDKAPYVNIQRNEWLTRDGYQIMYCSPDKLTLLSIYKLVRESSFDFTYTNSLFGKLTHGLLLLNWLTGRRIIIAPRGELQPGALRLKSYKKYPFVWLVKLLSRGQIVWHATNVAEQEAIKRIFPASPVGIAPVVLAPDTPKQLQPRATYRKQTGRARLVFISRITSVKGLTFLLDVLSDVSTKHRIELDIFGPIDDDVYWRNCQKKIREIGSSCTVTYRGLLPHDEVNTTLKNYDFFVLPSLSESFGHAIFEAFSVGIPVIISDQTPWRNLVFRKAGWDIPHQKQQWLDVLREIIAMDNERYNALSEGARSLAETYINDEHFLEKYQLLFS